MDKLLIVSLFAIVIFIITLVAARIPYMIERNEDNLHRLLSLSAGVMIGVLFIMLMPEALERTVDGGYNFENAAYAIMIGFMLLLVIDFVVKKYLGGDCGCDSHTHKITSMSAFLGLAIHSFFDGLALAAAFVAGEDVGILVLIALCLHKSVVVFSLASTMVMSEDRDKGWKYLVAFSAISPLATVISYLFLDVGDMGFAGLALCFSVGVFMFVTMCDMLPEAFHGHRTDVKQIGMMAVGLAIVIVVSAVSGVLMGGLEI
ncbi:MAG: ZIP family metal transporter [archaeon]|nr:ZIP family metal transporter [archaeon]